MISRDYGVLKAKLFRRVLIAISNHNPRILLYGIAGFINRGCEAIVRTTTSLIKWAHPGSEVFLASYRTEEDASLQIDQVDGYIRHGVINPRSAWFIRKTRFRNDPSGFQEYVQRGVIEFASSCDLAVSVGGDNYCYGVPPYWLMGIDRALKRQGVKSILWGASIDKKDITSEVLNDLRLFEAITVRETDSYNNLVERGLDNVFLYPDPAFALETTRLPLPDNWNDNNTIGINMSPLVSKQAAMPEAVALATQQLITYILDSSDSSIALIPHVTLEHDNDYAFLETIFRRFQPNDRIMLIGPDHNATEYKGFISRCRCFVGARTHSLIAAYSSCVPALALGFSIKARGIAKDIMGDYRHVHMARDLTDQGMLVEYFKRLQQEEPQLRDHLEEFIPKYISRTEGYLDLLRGLPR